jgi:hypothetical protein
MYLAQVSTTGMTLRRISTTQMQNNKVRFVIEDCRNIIEPHNGEREQVSRTPSIGLQKYS